jgi:hypothetical protein
LLNIAVEFTAEELEDAIITPNTTLDDVHMPLLKVSSWLLLVGLWGFLGKVVLHVSCSGCHGLCILIVRLVIVMCYCPIKFFVR